MSVETEVQKAFESLDKQRQDLDRQIKEKQAQIKSLATDVEMAKAKASAEISKIKVNAVSEIKRLEAGVEPIRAKISALQDQEMQKQAVIKTLDKEIEDRRADIFKLAQERQQLESLRAISNEQLKAVQNEVQTILSKMRAL